MIADLVQMRDMRELGEKGIAERQATVDVPRQRQAGNEGRAEEGHGQERLLEGCGELHVDCEESIEMLMGEK